MKRKLVFWLASVVLSLSLTGWVYGEELGERFNQARELYEKGQYSESLDILKGLVGEIEKIEEISLREPEEESENTLEVSDPEFSLSQGFTFMNLKVKNNSKYYFERLTLKASVYGANNNLLATENSFMENIKSGKYRDFIFIFLDRTIASDVKRWEIHIENIETPDGKDLSHLFKVVGELARVEVTSIEPEEESENTLEVSDPEFSLEVTSIEPEEEIENTLEVFNWEMYSYKDSTVIKFRVKNNSKHNFFWVNLQVSVYDSDGSQLETSSFSRGNIASEKSRPFSFYFQGDILTKIKSWEIQIEDLDTSEGRNLANLFKVVETSSEDNRELLGMYGRWEVRGGELNMVVRLLLSDFNEQMKDILEINGKFISMSVDNKEGVEDVKLSPIFSKWIIIDDEGRQHENIDLSSFELMRKINKLSTDFRQDFFYEDTTVYSGASKYFYILFQDDLPDIKRWKKVIWVKSYNKELPITIKLYK